MNIAGSPTLGHPTRILSRIFSRIVLVGAVLATSLAGAAPNWTATASPLPPHVTPPVSDTPKPTVGVIRWDTWSATNQDSPDVTTLGQPQWRYRLPFYSQVLSPTTVSIREDTQAVMDQEIQYASAAGINYWAFDMFGGHEPYGINLYLSSARVRDMDFSLILGHGGVHGLDWYKVTVPEIVSLMKQPTFQTVQRNRPLLYIFDPQSWSSEFGSVQGSHNAIDALRTAATAAGLPNPYIVGQVWDAPSGSAIVDQLGLNAIGGYTHPAAGSNQQYPYSQLAQANQQYWGQGAATGDHVVPVVNASWDPRPRWEEGNTGDPLGPYYKDPTPAELAGNLNAALKWNANNPLTANANTVLVYAWNETSEGGANIVPTLSEGTARLDAIAPVIAKWDARPT